MSNKILKFADFKNGNPLQEPKKHALTTKGEPKPKKEKSFDQVKRSNLGQLTVTQPDYSKTKNIDEAVSAEVQEVQVEIDELNVKLGELNPNATDYKDKVLALDKELLLKTQAIEAKREAEAKKAAVTA